MNELIDKELAIQTILGEYPDAHYPSWYADIIRKIEPAHESLFDDSTLIVTLNTDNFYNVGRVILKDQSGIWCRTMYQGASDIIRCKDCKYMTEHYDTDENVPYWTCSEWDSGTDYDGFCHYAERKAE